MQQITAAMKHASVVDRCKSMPGMPVRKLAITEDSEYSLQLLKIGVAKTKTARVHWLALFQVEWFGLKSGNERSDTKCVQRGLGQRARSQ